MAAPTQYSYRTSKGIGVIDAAPVYELLPGFQKPEGNLRCSAYSPCGRYLAWASTESVTIVDASIGHVVTTLDAPNVFELGFSPLGTFIITWQRPSKDEEGNAVKNLKVWKVIESQNSDGNDEHNVVGRFVQKSQTGWNLQYTQDEKYCARAVTNEVQFYESGNLGTVWNKLRVEGVSDFALSPGTTNSIATFIPERKGQPAAVKIFNVPNFSSAISQKNFFKGDKVQLKWNQHGTNLIVLAQTEVDKSNQNYYGETTLYLLSANGGFDSRIELDKEGPIYDVSWSPNSKEFGVVYGYVPAKTTIFNTKAVATHSFALGMRNTILFSPYGRFVLVAGFGNMAGDIDIYDLDKDYAKVCTIKASNSSLCEWSPDGQYILTATTSPRLRVDNGVRIWHVSGSLMFKEDMHELYQVIWRPGSGSSSPPQNPLEDIPAPHASALAFLGTVKTPSKPAGAYRPPGARGTSTPLAFMREDQGGAAYVRESGGSGLSNGLGKPRKREVPGAETATPALVDSAVGADAADETLSKAALKNKKKREAKKAKDAADRAAGLTPASNNGGRVNAAGIASSPGRSPERRDRGGHERTRSRNGSEVRPRSQNRARSQRRDGSAAKGAPNGTKQGGGAAPSGAASASATAGLSTASPAAADPATPDLMVTSPGGNTPHDKKIRALTKKLRAIDDLKMRRASGEVLENTQVKKMETEDAVRKELEGLGWTEGE